MIRIVKGTPLSRFGDYKDCNTRDIEDYRWLINPVEEDPEYYFTYMADGTIVPKTGLTSIEEKKAMFTINRFNLNHGSLKNMRRDIIMQVLLCCDLDDDTIRECFQGLGFPSVVEWSIYYREFV